MRGPINFLWRFESRIDRPNLPDKQLPSFSEYKRKVSTTKYIGNYTAILLEAIPNKVSPIPPTAMAATIPNTVNTSVTIKFSFSQSQRLNISLINLSELIASLLMWIKRIGQSLRAAATNLRLSSLTNLIILLWSIY